MRYKCSHTSGDSNKVAKTETNAKILVKPFCNSFSEIIS